MIEAMENATISKTEIKPSTISGQGTFATEKIRRGEYITTLIGEHCPLSRLEQRSIEMGMTWDDALQIDEEMYMIPEPTSKVINHSCNPNAGLRGELDLYAIKDIAPGEEITIDYSTTVGITDDYEMTCRCGEDNCRHLIANILTIPAETLERYMALDGLPDFIKRQLQAIGKIP